MTKTAVGLLLATMVTVSRLDAGDPGVAEVLKEWPQGGGFAIVVGASEAGFLAGLTNGGRMLVHGLCADDATRDGLRSKLISQGEHGLASVATWEGQPRLPYASRLGDVIVADLDALGAKAPGMAELERVLAPDGVLYLRTKGAWRASRPKRTTGLDDSGHFDHGRHVYFRPRRECPKSQRPSHRSAAYKEIAGDIYSYSRLLGVAEAR